MKHLAAALAVLALVPPAAAVARDCAVTGVEGGVARFEVDGFWHELAAGPLPGHARRIETLDGARIEIACDDGLVVTVGPSTALDLGDLQGDADAETSLVLDLLEGILGLVAPGQDLSVLEVRTPLVIASVRSTQWLVEHDGDGVSAVFVRAGTVRVDTVDAADGAPGQFLGPGDGITVTEAGAEPVKQWGPARIEAVETALGFGWR